MAELEWSPIRRTGDPQVVWSLGWPEPHALVERMPSGQWRWYLLGYGAWQCGIAPNACVAMRDASVVYLRLVAKEEVGV